MAHQEKARGRARSTCVLVTLAGLSLLPHAAFAEERNAGDAAAAVPRAPLPSSPQLKGVVEVIVQGQTTALGVVLANDGRIVTALSSLSPSSTTTPAGRAKGPIEVRFSDGRTSPASLAHKHETLDLALLIPSHIRFRTGYQASDRDPRKDFLSFATLGKAGHPVLVGASFGSEKELQSGAKGWDLYVIPNVTPGWTPGDAGAAPSNESLSAMLGSPVLDAAGNVVGLATRSGASSPLPSPAVVDVAQIREFLMQSPSDAVFPPVWLGVSGVSEVVTGGEALVGGSSKPKRGVRVKAIANGGPADKAGLVIAKDPKKNPLILEVNKIAVETPEALAAVVSKYMIEDHIFLTLADGDSTRTLEVILEPKPPAPKK